MRADEHTEKIEMATPKIGTDWDGQLSEWLDAIHQPSLKRRTELIQDFCFPTEALRNEYLASISSRSREDVTDLLRLFLFDAGAFAADDRHRETWTRGPEEMKALSVNTEYHRRVFTPGLAAQPGTRWVLDLLPHWPRSAINGIQAYWLAHCQILPDGRLTGLSDAIDLIQAFYINSPADAEGRRLSLFDVSPRDFERLVERLYSSMGYATRLTPSRADGGRDILAAKSTPGHREDLRIECKLHREPVGVGLARQLLGVVSHERSNKGVLVTSSRFTKGRSGSKPLMHAWN
jgi:restriction system protein